MHAVGINCYGDVDPVIHNNSNAKSSRCDHCLESHSIELAGGRMFLTQLDQSGSTSSQSLHLFGMRQCADRCICDRINLGKFEEHLNVSDRWRWSVVGAQWLVVSAHW